MQYRLEHGSLKHGSLKQGSIKNGSLIRNSLTAMLVCLCLAGCGEPKEAEQPVQILSPSEKLFADAVINDEVMRKWSRSCALCHVNGEGGAPRMGNREEWQSRLNQGEQLLMKHAIEGLGNMPPLGYCMACEREDLRALSKLMIGEQG